MNKRKLGSFVLGVMLIALGFRVEAQQPGKSPRIVYLSGSSIISANTEAFQQDLRDLGYIEGKNIVIEYRYAEGNVDGFSELAAELVRLKVDIIVVPGGGQVHPGGHECDQDDSHRYGGPRGRSRRGGAG